MSEKGVKLPPAVPYICSLFMPKMVHAARPLGYAIALHGSISTDIDVVAIPWTDEATSPDILVKALAEAVSGIPDEKPTMKPHGRMSYNIAVFESTTWIDLCVMPRRLKLRKGGE